MAGVLVLVDIVDRVTRSRIMSAIRSSNTKPEIITRQHLHRLGYRYRLSSSIGKIKPDIVLRRLKVAIFVHGCYWHQHKNCRLAYSDREYSAQWKKKFADNRDRDKRVIATLRKQGWRIAIIWECATRNVENLDQTINQLDDWIKSGDGWYFESTYRKV